MKKNSRLSEISHVLGTPTKDIDASNQYLDKVIQNIKKVKYPISYLLMDISNALLVISTKEDYATIKDPLKTKKKYIQEKLKKYQDIHDNTTKAIQVLKNNNLEQELQTSLKEKVVTVMLNDIESITKEQNEVEKLEQQRNKFYLSYKGLFHCMPRKLTTTFIEKYESVTKKVLSKNTDILKYLIEQRSIIEQKGVKSDEKIEELCKLFEVDLETTQKTKQISAKTLRPLKTKIDCIIGKIEDKEIEQYIKNKSINTTTKEKLRNQILQDLEGINEVTEKLIAYMGDVDYLNEIAKQSFLVQVRTYRGITRDLQKSIILTENDKMLVVMSPGQNTVININPSGATSIEVGEFGSYKRIANNNSATLENYQDFHYNSVQQISCNPKEKEKFFTTLFQIEAIRNPSALLTIPMFFELAKINYKDYYSFKEIADKMPMAMKGAVSGSVYIEKILSEYYCVRLPYDYREEGDMKNAEILDKKNQQILFDWLSYKINITNVINAASQDKPTFSLNKEINVNDGSNEYVCKVTDKLSNKGYRLTSKNFIIEITKISNNPDNYDITTIKSCSLEIFKELMTHWYGKKLIEKVENWFFLKNQLIPIEIKAQAEPKEIKRNEDDQDSAAVAAESINNLSFDNTYSTSWQCNEEPFTFITVLGETFASC